MNTRKCKKCHSSNLVLEDVNPIEKFLRCNNCGDVFSKSNETGTFEVEFKIDPGYSFEINGDPASYFKQWIEQAKREMQEGSNTYSHEEVFGEDQYESLRDEFENAIKQASGGKGKERHARKGQDFEDQVMCSVQRLLVDHPLGGLAYQVIKKTIESGRLYQDKGADNAVKEIYGAMNYLGGMNILYKELDEDKLNKLDF